MELCQKLVPAACKANPFTVSVDGDRGGRRLPPALLNLACLRASQIQASAPCIARYWSELREAGESEHRLYLLDAWRDAGVFTARERAALAYTEATIRVGRCLLPTTMDRALTAQLTPSERDELTAAIAGVSTRNRLGISFQTLAGVSAA